VPDPPELSRKILKWRKRVELKRQLGLASAIFIIIGDMIGTGIFSTTGFILADVHSAGIVLLLWVVGGIVALTGSLSYAELATMWPEAGGEYQYLKRIYGQLPAFLTGWISLFVGFSAAVATSAMVLGKYFLRFVESVNGENRQSVSGAQQSFHDQADTHSADCVFRLGAYYRRTFRKHFQNVLTVLKIGLVIILAGVGLFSVKLGLSERLTAVYAGQDGATSAGIPATGLALLMVMFAYSGWNAAAYMGGEIKKTEKKSATGPVFRHIDCHGLLCAAQYRIHYGDTRCRAGRS
jgi:APA family basic amino acid/polyamine antiporter